LHSHLFPFFFGRKRYVEKRKKISLDFIPPPSIFTPQDDNQEGKKLDDENKIARSQISDSSQQLKKGGGVQEVCCSALRCDAV